MANDNDSSNADRWTPSNYVRNLTYVVKEIGMTSLVILVLLGQKTGWVPDISIAQETHQKISLSTYQIVDTNRAKINEIALNVLRTKDYAQQSCLQGKKPEESYMCVDGYEWLKDKPK